MANGYIIAATADQETARSVAPGFDLEFCDISGDQDALFAQLAAAPGVCIVLSAAAAQDEAYVALLQRLSGALSRVQLLLVTADARDAFAFLPAEWPAISLEQAQAEVGDTPPPPLEETPPTSQDAAGITPGQAIDEPAPTMEEQSPTVTQEPTAPEEPAPTGGELGVEPHELEAERAEPEASGDDPISLGRAEQSTEPPTVDTGESEKLEDIGAIEDTLVGGAPTEPLASIDETSVKNARAIVEKWVIAHGATPAAAVAGAGASSPAFFIPEPLVRDVAAALNVGSYDRAEVDKFIQERLATSGGGITSAALGTVLAPSIRVLAARAAGDALIDFMRNQPASAGTQPEVLESEKLEDFGAIDDTLAGGAPSEPPQNLEETERAITLEPAPQAPPPAEPEPPPPAPVQTGGESTPEETSTPMRRQRSDSDSGSAAKPEASAPADATAFAPKKLRRGTPELVRIVIHQPSDLAAVIKAARKFDPRTAPAPQGMSIGDVALGASVGVALEVRGGACDGALQRRTWSGDAIDFNFSLEADADVKQAVILARVFVDDAQIGVIGFTRPVTGATKPQPTGDKARLKRHKRVFLSYSSKDRETVSAIATAYEAAGVAHFWDRASLKSGEEWHPRLRREIDRADLFHLCWSKDASASQWVERETEYALTRRRRSNGKKPDITVQMLDGPPWAPHPASLDSINFDDFVRAAIVGYARGDGD